MYQDDDRREREREEDELELQLEPFHYEIAKNRQNIERWADEIRNLGPTQALGRLVINRRMQIADARQRIVNAQRQMQQIRANAEEFTRMKEREAI
jgi:hypothetical protein